jgi:peptide/nickel transport system substrate-binding protein
MPVTAEDVVFSLESMVDPDAVRPQVGALGDYYKGSIAIDANTVQVDTKFKAAAFVPLFAADFIQIRAKHRFEGMSDDDAKLQENQLGSGPFMVKRAEKDVVIEYVRNPDYFKEGLPYVDGVTWFIVLSPAATFAAHEAGQALMASSIASRMNNTSATQLAESTLGKGTVHWGGPAAGLSIFMNHEKPPFDDKNVRLALSLAIDRHQMINTLALGRATLGYAMPPGLYYSIPDAEVAQLPGYRLLDGEKHPDDIAEAQRLMAAAGLADGFTTEIMAHGIADTIDISQIAADGWRKWLNLDIEVVQEAFGTALERRNNGDYLMYTDTDGVTYLDPDDMFSRRYGSDSLHADYNSWSGNARIDEIRALQTSEFDLQVRGDLIREAAELFLVDAPWAVLYWKDLFMFVDNRVRNFHMQVTAYTKTGLYENLWCDPQC